MTRTRAILAGSVLVALALAFATGRLTAAPKAVTRDVVKVETRDVVKTNVVHDVATVHDVAWKTNTRTVTRWVKAPDGTVSVVQEEQATKDEVSRAQKAAHDALDTKRETDQTVVESHTSAPATRPDWSATALVGGQLGGRSLLVPAPYVVGVMLERHILGPVSAGLWATTGMAGGLSVRVDF